MAIKAMVGLGQIMMSMIPTLHTTILLKAIKEGWYQFDNHVCFVGLIVMDMRR